jgi:hypothetical protein
MARAGPGGSDVGAFVADPRYWGNKFQKEMRMQRVESLAAGRLLDSK